jgi:hypothetical protein
MSVKIVGTEVMAVAALPVLMGCDQLVQRLGTEQRRVAKAER